MMVPQELQKVKKRILSVFWLDNRTRKNYRSTENIKPLTSLEVKHQKVITGIFFSHATYCYPCMPIA